MLVNDDKMKAVYKKVKFIREEYRQYVIGNDTTYISIEDLQHIIAGMYGLEIRKTEVPGQPEFIRGMMERWGKLIKIRLRRGQEYDWKRFTAVKEMCHAVIDEQEDWSTEGVSTIIDLLFEFALESMEHEAEEANRVSQSEVLAEVAALEILYSFEFRDRDRKRIEDKQATVETIAAEHGIPVAMISRALAKTYHQDIATPLWTAIELEVKANAAAK